MFQLSFDFWPIGGANNVGYTGYSFNYLLISGKIKAELKDAYAILSFQLSFDFWSRRAQEVDRKSRVWFQLSFDFWNSCLRQLYGFCQWVSTIFWFLVNEHVKRKHIDEKVVSTIFWFLDSACCGVHKTHVTVVSTIFWFLGLSTRPRGVDSDCVGFNYLLISG